MGIKLGNIDAKYIKVGSGDCKVYLGDTLLYPSSPTPIYEWKQYNAGATVPSKLFYGVKLGDPGMEEASIEFGDAINTDIAFVFDINSEYGWYAQDISGEQIDISEYYDETEGCYIIYFSDLGLGAMPIYYPIPSESFEFDVQLYEEVPQWVTFNNGDTIPSDLDVYGVSGISQNLLDTYGSSGSYIQFQLSKRWVEYYIYNSDSSYCGDGSELATDPMEIIFSNRGCSDFINQGATVSGTIQLYIYA